MLESIKNSFMTFSQEHIFLSFALRGLIAVIILVTIFRLFGFACSLIYSVLEKIVGGFDKINSVLNETIAPYNKSSNPWGMAASLGLASAFFFAFDGISIHRILGLIIAGISLLTGVVTAGSGLPLVLLFKIIRIPLDIVSVPFRVLCWITMIFAGLTGAFDRADSDDADIPPFTGGTSGGSGSTPGRIPRPGTGTIPVQAYVPHSYDDETPSSSYSYSDDSSDHSTPSDFSDGYSYFGDQHTDQHRTSEEGGASGYYYGTSESGQTVYYSGDYRPYNGTGENIEYHHIDEDYAPMDMD